MIRKSLLRQAVFHTRFRPSCRAVALVGISRWYSTTGSTGDSTQATKASGTPKSCAKNPQAKAETEGSPRCVEASSRSAKGFVKTAGDSTEATEDSIKSAEDFTEVTEDSIKSAEDSTEATEDSIKSAEDFTEVTKDSIKSSDNFTEATKDTFESAEDSTEATEDSIKSAEDSTEATEDSIKSAEDSTEATKDTFESAEDSTEATKDSIESAEDSTEATKDSIKSAEDSTEVTKGTFESAEDFTEVPKVSMRSIRASAPAAPLFKLRDYQLEAVDSVIRALEEGIKRPAVVLATGGGKTVVMAHLLSRIPSKPPKRYKTLVLCHKDELLYQAVHTVRNMNPGLVVGIDRRRIVPLPDAHVVVASVGTIMRASRLQKYDPAEYKTILVDECHHAPAISWLTILSHFGALLLELEISVVGFTATMERADGKALNEVFEKIVYRRDLHQMVQAGELCDARFMSVDVDLDLDEVKRFRGDYNPVQLGMVVNREDVNGQVVKAYMQLREEVGLKSTLVFCVTVEHCQAICGALQAYGVNAQYVTGTTDPHVRQTIVKDFRDGKIAVLCNVLVFTEGTDIPNIDLIILARPTKSRPLLMQMLGRGLRLHQGKTTCYVIDMVHTLHVGVLSVPTLFGLPATTSLNGKTFDDLVKEKEQVDLKVAERATRERERNVLRIIEYQRDLQHIRLQFETYESFAQLLLKERLADPPERVLELFRRSGYDWVRLEYNTWGILIYGEKSYFTLERVNTEKEGSYFELYRNEPVSYDVLRINKFKCPRKTLTLVNEGSLDYLLSVAAKVLRIRKFKPPPQKPALQRQIEYLISLLLSKVRKTHGGYRLEDFENALKKMNIRRAHNLIFAYKFSANCLWVSWELRKLLGMPLSWVRKVAGRQMRMEEIRVQQNITEEEVAAMMLELGDAPIEYEGKEEDRWDYD